MLILTPGLNAELNVERLLSKSYFGCVPFSNRYTELKTVLFAISIQSDLVYSLAGALGSALDCVFVTQSVSLKTNITRFLYITPPVMMMPISYVVAREALEGLIGDRHSAYTLASIPPAVIWSFFRNSPFKGFRMFLGIGKII